MSGQTELGKAFEYSCLMAMKDYLWDKQNVIIQNTSALATAQQFYNTVDAEEATKLDLAARAAIRIIVKFEPQLEYCQKLVPLELVIQDDSQGIKGDVRDVLCIRQGDNWEIGLSCKHNHFALKHSRLSNTIDFGEQWFKRPCSDQYFSDIEPLFMELRELKSQNELWRNITNKAERFYVPLLEAFISEINRLDNKFPGEIPAALINYLLGRKDFYKVIAIDSQSVTRIQPYNIYGTLNKKAGGIHPVLKIPRLKLPTRIYDIRFKDESDNTIIITCDNGWAVSLRIHSASTKVEASLKFDVNLVGTPNDDNIMEMW